jgi:hypothetical protein
VDSGCIRTNVSIGNRIKTTPFGNENSIDLFESMSTDKLFISGIMILKEMDERYRLESRE